MSFVFIHWWLTLSVNSLSPGLIILTPIVQTDNSRETSEQKRRESSKVLVKQNELIRDMIIYSRTTRPTEVLPAIQKRLIAATFASVTSD